MPLVFKSTPPQKSHNIMIDTTLFEEIKSHLTGH